MPYFPSSFARFCLFSGILLTLILQTNLLIAKTFYISDENISALKQAIREAEETPEYDTISLAQFGHYTFIAETHEHHDVSLLPAIHSGIYIKGNGAIFQGIGEFKHSLFRIDKKGILTVKNLIISFFDTNSDGGVFYCKGIFLADNCEFFGNHAHKGGVIYNTHQGFISVINSAFIGNRAGSSHHSKHFHGGGAIFNHGKMQIVHSTFQKNYLINGTANENLFHAGGAIFNTGRNVTLKDCNFFGNHAQFDGSYAGAVWHQNKTEHSFEIQNCRFQNNEAHNGGAVRCQSSAPNRFQLSESEFINNSPHLDSNNYETDKLKCKDCVVADSQ